MFEQYIAEQLALRQSRDLLRKTSQIQPIDGRLIEVDKQTYLNFASNDYLGLAFEPNSNVSAQVTSSEPILSGAMSSPLVTGYQTIHVQLQQQILDLVGASSEHDCLLFSSGFAANNAVIKSLFNVKDSNALLFQDRLNHASLLDAGISCQALGHCRQHRFKHNDIDDLAHKLALNSAHGCKKLIVTEGIFSMDGDGPDLAKMSQLARQNNALIMVDDAHGIGVLGERGAGSIAQQGLPLDAIDILVVTFGKAVGAQGAAVIAKKPFVDYFVNFAKEYIYSTHLSPIQTACVSRNLTAMMEGPWRQTKLHTNIAYFRDRMKKVKLTLLNSLSPIQPVLVGNDELAVQFSAALKQQGIWLSAIRPPTVPKGQARLRITITSQHDKHDIDVLVQALIDVQQQLECGNGV